MLQLDVEALRTLLSVIDHGSITRAASSLHVSRSAASWRIKRLEQQVGQQLLIREGRNVAATRTAQTILADSRLLVENHDRVAQQLGGAHLTGMITVGADSDADVVMLTRLLGSFRRVNPGVDINLVIDQAQQILDQMVLGEIDIALIQGLDEHIEPADRVVWSDTLVWVTGRNHSFEDSTVPLVIFGSDCFYRAIGEPALDAAGIEYRVALSVPCLLYTSDAADE